ncbi:MAG: DUF5309 family protein [Thermoguttaceae bacterium]|nr:DUF5309 family protein [Thermoguttaceae bacterium]
MTVSTNDLLNVRIDLSDVLSWRAAQTPRLIRLFPTRRGPGEGGPKRVATATEHFWLEGLDAPKTKSYSALAESGSESTFTVTDPNGWAPGDLFHILGDHGVMRVASVSASTIVAVRVAGSDAAFLAPDEGTLVFDSRPIQEGSASGENFFMQSQAESNCTQIFRGDVALTGTAEAVSQAGMENAITTQLEYATDAIVRRINAALVFGVRTRRTATEPGAMGGLYYFGTQTGGLARPQTGTPPLSMALINRAAQDVLDAGCLPDTIVCGAGQAQVISTFMASQVQVPQNSREAGRFVDSFVTSAGGATMKVVVEPSIPDTDVWVCDSRGFALVPLAGRALHTEPASTPGVDGRRAILLGEYTAEFKNAKQALCRISGLRASSEVLV